MKREQGEAEIRLRAKNLLDKHLCEQGLRWTKQREAILAAFLDANAHVSVEELYSAMRDANPEIGPATVYRCMNLFVKAGIAKERRFNEGRGRFESAVDVTHHDHLICTSCGDILEFEDPRIERLQEEIAGALGFTVVNHRMELYGVCPKCRKSEPEESQP